MHFSLLADRSRRAVVFWRSSLVTVDSLSLAIPVVRPRALVSPVRPLGVAMVPPVRPVMPSVLATEREWVPRLFPTQGGFRIRDSPRPLCQARSERASADSVLARKTGVRVASCGPTLHRS